MAKPRISERSASGLGTFESLRARIAERHPRLSPQLRKIAAHVIEHPNDAALGTVAEVARGAGVPPSAIVRFAKALDFDGFSAMQLLFRSRLVEGQPSYRQRIEAMRRDRGDRSSVLAECAAQGIAALEHLRAGEMAQRLGAAADLLAGAASVHVLAQGRSFPVAYYAWYALARLERNAHLVDGIGGSLKQQAALIGRRDVLLVVSFRPYAEPVVAAATERAAAGAPVVAITDGPLSPLARCASVALEAPQGDEQSIRSLVAPMCLAQSLVLELGHRIASTENGRSRHARKT
ncbi:MAG: MurR/RpiR family transcriptional regulator [Alphaproteobacteria bacterium]|nr:MurR/RpiR family transcriptional regulator [Alphaproteobacteria bacterium]